MTQEVYSLGFRSMINFQIQPDSEIPASKQLLAQIQFAIASGQYPPGHRLPSTRQLAMITGLHRNTISKVYRQLEETGLIESLAGSGIYVKAQGNEGNPRDPSPILQKYPEANKIIKESIDDLFHQGCTLSQVRELFLAEIDWRIRCSRQVIVTVPARDIDAGKIMILEIEQFLAIPVQLVTLEQLPQYIEQTHFGTVVTIHYFIKEVLEHIPPQSFRVITVDIYDYAKELQIVKSLPKGACLGIVSLSAGTLDIAESIVNSLRGDDILIMSAPISDRHKLRALIRTANTIISDPASFFPLKEAIASARDDLIRIPDLIRSENYIGANSINLLKRELGLGDRETL